MGKKNQRTRKAKRKASVRERKIKSIVPWRKIRLIIVLLWFLGIQIIGFFLPKSEFEKAKQKVISNPQDFEARLILAENLLQNNRLTEAERELSASLKFHHQASGSPSQQANDRSELVLGKQTSKLKELTTRKQENNPKDLEILIQKWQKILTEKLDYRDGWLKLALYSIKVGKINEAQEAIQKAKELDPNYEVTGKLEKLLP